MKKLYPPLLALAGMLLVGSAAQAKQGAPHTVKVEPDFSTVGISWQSPESAKQLKWHDDNDYDGDAGMQISSQRPAQLFIASEFTASDLKSYVGEKIVSVNYFEYRPCLKVTALLYEDGKIVREADFDLHTPAFKANTVRTAAFKEPYVIPEGKTIRVALRIEHGSNFDFVAIMNKVANPKGDLISYDGKTWRHNGRGTYLITANLFNDVDEAPTGYNVYADGKKVNTAALTDLSFSLPDQTNGSHTYKVEAVYAGASYASKENTVQVKGTDMYFPAPSSFDIVTDGVDGLMEWGAPLMRKSDNLLTWTNKTLANAIGGTASSNTKVWIKNEFSASDLLSFAGADITAVNAQFHEKVVNSMIIYVLKDGAFVQYDTIAPERIAEITVDKWERFPFSKPVRIEPGSKYAYGYYMMHTPKAHPVSVDNGIAVGSKANSFSTSSPNSKDFANSKPSWKTLASGGIGGNWMLTADVAGGEQFSSTLSGYNLYRDGVLIKEGLTKPEYEDVVPAPGTYTYSVQAVGTGGKSSELLDKQAVYKLPDSYRAPLISEAKLDKNTGIASLKWGMDVELRHYSSAKYKVGFDEEMTLAYGSRFTASQLADYAGYKITKLNFVIGEAIPAGFKLEIYNGEGKLLSSSSIAAKDVTPLAMYTLTLDTPVEITGKEDLIFAYNATLPASTSPIVLDEGPLTTGGAVVKLAGMSNWINLGTINATYNNYNIVIGAVASESASASAPGRTVQIGGAVPSLSAATLDADALRQAHAVEPLHASPATGRRRALNPAKFNIYRNGELAATTDKRSFSETLPGYDTYSYTISAIYPNGWESAESDPAIIAHGIEQLGRAPYNLRMNDKKTGFIWDDAKDAPTLSYAIEGSSFGVGMTGSGERTTYAVHKYPADSLKNLAGHKITHVRFALYSTELNSASIVIFKNLNIAYEQEIPVSSLVTISDKGYNTIRLNVPFEITAGDDIMIGYHITYANGIKPMIFDCGPADDGLGNLMSASASSTSWKTLKSLNKSLDGNWRIYAFMEAPDGKMKLEAPRKAEDAVTYNLYCDGKILKDGIKAKSYDPERLLSGKYTVTSVENGEESAPSNILDVNNTNGIESVGTEAAPYYDATARILVLPAGMSGVIYDAAGSAIAAIDSSHDMGAALPGVYIFVYAKGKTIKFVR